MSLSCHYRERFISFKLLFPVSHLTATGTYTCMLWLLFIWYAHHRLWFHCSLLLHLFLWHLWMYTYCFLGYVSWWLFHQGGTIHHVLIMGILPHFRKITMFQINYEWVTRTGRSMFVFMIKSHDEVNCMCSASDQNDPSCWQCLRCLIHIKNGIFIYVVISDGTRDTE